MLSLFLFKLVAEFFEMSCLKNILNSRKNTGSQLQFSFGEAML